MIKKFILSICLLFSLVTFAQEGTSSPYSFYGIGDVKFKGTVENRSMGGLTIFPDSIHVNFQNPAAYSSLKLTTFSIGGTYLTTKFKTSSQEEKARRTALDYFVVGLPIGKFGAGFGLIQYSAVGYKIKTTEAGPPQTIRNYSGSGGLNKAFFGLGYEISPKFRIGVDVSYNFGKIQTNSFRFVENVQDGSREKNISDMNGVTFSSGLMFQSKINKRLSVFSSLVFSPESKLKSINERKTATIQYTPSGEEVITNEKDVQVDNTTIKLPTKLSIGTGIGELKKWMIGTEITFQQSSNFGNRFNDIDKDKDKVKYENAIKYNIGGYYIPNYNSFSSYFKKITYRGGVRYENTGLIFNDKSINDLGLNLGLGLPIPGVFSNINLGLELGKRGTTAAN